jgi:stage II sporulation protein AA (anti-sigma F factor antagonist)
MDLQYQLTEGKLVVPMPKEVDHHIAKNMSREIDFLIDSWHVRDLVFDFADTDFMDSSGIGILIGRKRIMDLYCGDVCAVHLGERVTQIFEKSGLFRIIRIADEEVREG